MENKIIKAKIYKKMEKTFKVSILRVGIITNFLFHHKNFYKIKYIKRLDADFFIE